MPSDDDTARRLTPGAEMLALRAENERLKAYLARVLDVLESRIDDGAASPVVVELVDDDDELDARAVHRAGALMLIGEAPDLSPGASALPVRAQDREALVDVAERVATVQRDLARVEAHVETLLWRLGARRGSLAAGS